MSLDGVELGVEVRQGGDADDHDAPGAGELTQPLDGGAIVVEVLDDVQGQDCVVAPSPRW